MKKKGHRKKYNHKAKFVKDCRGFNTEVFRTDLLFIVNFQENFLHEIELAWEIFYEI